MEPIRPISPERRHATPAPVLKQHEARVGSGFDLLCSLTAPELIPDAKHAASLSEVLIRQQSTSIGLRPSGDEAVPFCRLGGSPLGLRVANPVIRSTNHDP